MRPSRPKDALWGLTAGALVALAACTVEVNVNTHDHEHDGEAGWEVTVTPDAPRAPAAQTPDTPERAPEPPTAPRLSAPPSLLPIPPIPSPPVIPPTPPAPPTQPDAGVIRDALFRFGQPNEPARSPALEEITTGPTFTPFTRAPRVVNRLQILEALERHYPPQLKDAGIGGTVRVYFLIDSTGDVRDIRLDQGSSQPALDEAAFRVARVYRFRAAENRGRAVPVWVSFPIRFQVQ